MQTLFKSISRLPLIFAATLLVSQAGPCCAAVTEQAATSLYNQKKYFAAADAFERLMQTNPTPRILYYAALCNHGAGRKARYRQLLSYLVAVYPASQEANLAKQVVGTSTTSFQPPPPTKSQNNEANLMAVIDKAEEMGLVAKAPPKPQQAVPGSRPFTPEDIAKLGAHGIDQTRYPNCWFEASMAALAELPRGQELISSMIKLKDSQTFTVRFPGDGVEYEVKKSDVSKNGIRDKALWARLLQDAQCQKYPDNSGAQGKYDDQSRIEVGLQTITGARAELLHPTAEMTDQEISHFIGAAVTRKMPVVCCTWGAAYYGSRAPLVVPQHAYTIIGFDPSTNMITIRNPHGMNSVQHALANDDKHHDFEQLPDGVFKMSIRVFKTQFAQVARSFF